MSWFSTLCKDIASQGHIVFSLEHNDGSALHTYDDNKQHKYYKSFDMRDQNKIVMNLGTRVKEIHGLIDELSNITKQYFGSEIELANDHLTVMGHGLGATSAISLSNKEERVKKIISLDPWLTPIKEEVMSKVISVKQPHCSINSEMFQANFTDNWELLTNLYNRKGA